MSSAHGKTDSDATSLGTSSPARSPPQPPAYYVQSPSRDSSQDGEKTTNSFGSSPVLSQVGSPPHSSSSVGHRSSSTGFYGSLKPASSRKILPNGAAAGGVEARRKKWKEFAAIEEEGLLDGFEDGTTVGIPRRCYSLAFAVGFFALFSLFSVILWGASRSQKPSIAVKVSN